MAFLRFSRDKRGYEHFYLVETTPDRRGKTHARVLYWFRSPPGVKVGREPFDADVRRALEAQNPGIQFDWRKITETPIPSADAEKWRERRRVERAEKAARQALGRERGARETVEPTDDVDAIEPAEDDSIEDGSLDAAEQQADALAPTEESLVADSASLDPAGVARPSPARGHRRRRRRRGNRRSVQSPTPEITASAGSDSEAAPDPDRDSEPREPE